MSKAIISKKATNQSSVNLSLATGNNENQTQTTGSKEKGMFLKLTIMPFAI